MIKALLLDFYGVLHVDTYLAWVQKYRSRPDLIEQLDEVNHQLDLGKIDQQEYIAKLSDISGEPIAKVKKDLESRVGTNHELLTVIDQLRLHNIITAVLSNDGTALRQLMDDEAITPHFDHVFVSGEIGIMKPDVRIYQYVIQKMGIDPQQAIFFDDRQSNIDGAIRAGLQAELYTSVSQVRNLLADLL